MKALGLLGGIGLHDQWDRCRLLNQLTIAAVGVPVERRSPSCPLIIGLIYVASGRAAAAILLAPTLQWP